MTVGDLFSTHDIARQAAEIPAVANNLHPLMRAGDGQRRKPGCGDIADRRSQSDSPGCLHTDIRRHARYHGGIQLNGRTQQGLNDVTVTHRLPPL